MKIDATNGRRVDGLQAPQKVAYVHLDDLQKQLVTMV
jgi:hypothetical protein